MSFYKTKHLEKEEKNVMLTYGRESYSKGRGKATSAQLHPITDGMQKKPDEIEISPILCYFLFILFLPDRSPEGSDLLDFSKIIPEMRARFIQCGFMPQAKGGFTPSVVLYRPNGNTSNALECGSNWNLMGTPRGSPRVRSSKGNEQPCFAFKRFRSKAFFSVPDGSFIGFFTTLRFH